MCSDSISCVRSTNIDDSIDQLRLIILVPNLPPYLSGRPAILPEKQMLLFLWSVANRELNCIVRVPTLGRETKPDISCEWNTKFSIIRKFQQIGRVHSKRIPKFSKTFPGIFTVPFNLEPEISEFFGRMESARAFQCYSSQILSLT